MIIHAGDQDGVELILPLRMGGQGRGSRRGGVLLLLGQVLRLLRRVRILLGLHLGLADQNVGSGIDQTGDQDDQQKKPLPAAPALHDSFCHGYITLLVRGRRPR